MSTTALIPHQTATMIVEQVTQARAEVADAFALLHAAKQRLGAVLGDKDFHGYGHIWEGQISDFDLRQRAAQCDTAIACNAWRYLLAQTGMRAFMTKARLEAFEHQLTTGTVPALTVPNILSTMEGLYLRGNALLVESMQEVFDWLRPSHSPYKTNKRWMIGRKVIVKGLIERMDHTPGFWLRYHHEGHMVALGNVFSLLDGQGVLKYPDDLWTHFKQGVERVHPGELFTLPYMHARAYLTGTVHFMFTRQDLVDRFNQIVSNGSLDTGKG